MHTPRHTPRYTPRHSLRHSSSPDPRPADTWSPAPAPFPLFVRSAAMRRAVVLVAGVATVLGVLVLAPSRSEASPPSSDTTTAAQYGARWTAARVTTGGYVAGPTNAPNVSATVETALALQQAKVEEPTYRAIVAWLQGHIELAIDPDATNDSPGNLGELMLIASAAGVDPHSFGGVDLEARLAATLGQFSPGLYGKNDPTYDGAFRQSLAILGLRAVGATPSPAAVTWLRTQQCDASVPAAAGGWQAYRSDLATPCVAPNTTTFEGPDTNSSAMAVQALVAAGALDSTAKAAAMDFLAAAEDTTAGFAYIPGGSVDPNSTALVLLAIVAGGEDPGSGRWVRGAATPASSLLSWQLGCSAAASDQGAFASPFSGGAPDDLATRQAVWGAAGTPFSATSLVQFQVTPDPCVVTTTTTAPSSTTTSTTSSTTSSTTVGAPDPGAVPVASPATAVGASPAFAG